MKKKESYKFLMLIFIINLILYYLHHNTELPNLILGILMGIGAGMSVLLIYMLQKNLNRLKLKSFKVNIKNKLRQNNF